MMHKTLMKHAQDAIDVQDACNLSGVVHSLDICVSDLWELAHKMKKGTDWVNQHPIVQMYVDKLACLSRVQSSADGYIEKYSAVEQLTKGYRVDWDTAKQNMHDKSGIDNPDEYMYVLNQANHTYYPEI